MLRIILLFTLSLNTSAATTMNLEDRINHENKIYDDFKIMYTNKKIFNSILNELEANLRVIFNYLEEYSVDSLKLKKSYIKLKSLLKQNKIYLAKAFQMCPFKNPIEDSFIFIEAIKDIQESGLINNSWARILVKLTRSVYYDIYIIFKRGSSISEEHNFVLLGITKDLKCDLLISKIDLIVQKISLFKDLLKGFKNKLENIIYFIKCLEVFSSYTTLEEKYFKQFLKFYNEETQNILVTLDSLSGKYFSSLKKEYLHTYMIEAFYDSQELYVLPHPDRNFLNLRFLKYYYLFQNFLKIIKNFGSLQEINDCSIFIKCLKINQYPYNISFHEHNIKKILSFGIDERCLIKFENIFSKFNRNIRTQFHDYCTKNEVFLKKLINKNIFSIISDIFKYYLKLCNPHLDEDKKSEAKFKIQNAMENMFKLQLQLKIRGFIFLEKYYWIYEGRVLDFYETISCKFVNSFELDDMKRNVRIQNKKIELLKIYDNTFYKGSLELYFDIFSGKNFCCRLNKIFLMELYQKLNDLGEKLVKEGENKYLFSRCKA